MRGSRLASKRTSTCGPEMPTISSLTSPVRYAQIRSTFRTKIAAYLTRHLFTGNWETIKNYGQPQPISTFRPIWLRVTTQDNRHKGHEGSF